ncbi:MAG TPA: hypothetical protein VLD83_12135, partial [Candidatus Binatia bacterium]|nr:hypothetical protein [Candidatus Binatia bacterium]
MSYPQSSSHSTVHTFFFHPMSLVMMTLLPAFLTACGGPLVGVTVVDERTALENQVLGTYQELNQQVMLVASVRYIDSKGKLKQT